MLRAVGFVIHQVGEFSADIYPDCDPDAVELMAA